MYGEVAGQLASLGQFNIVTEFPCLLGHTVLQTIKLKYRVNHVILHRTLKLNNCQNISLKYNLVLVGLKFKWQSVIQESTRENGFPQQLFPLC